MWRATGASPMLRSAIALLPVAAIRCDSSRVRAVVVVQLRLLAALLGAVRLCSPTRMPLPWYPLECCSRVAAVVCGGAALPVVPGRWFGVAASLGWLMKGTPNDSAGSTPSPGLQRVGAYMCVRVSPEFMGVGECCWLLLLLGSRRGIPQEFMGI